MMLVSPALVSIGTLETDGTLMNLVLVRTSEGSASKTVRNLMGLVLVGTS